MPCAGGRSRTHVAIGGWAGVGLKGWCRGERQRRPKLEVSGCRGDAGRVCRSKWGRPPTELHVTGWGRCRPELQVPGWGRQWIFIGSGEREKMHQDWCCRGGEWLRLPLAATCGRAFSYKTTPWLKNYNFLAQPQSQTISFTKFIITYIFISLFIMYIVYLFCIKKSYYFFINLIKL